MLPRILPGFSQGSMILPNTIANTRPLGHLPKQLMPVSWSQWFASNPLLLPCHKWNTRICWGWKSSISCCLPAHTTSSLQSGYTFGIRPRIGYSTSSTHRSPSPLVLDGILKFPPAFQCTLPLSSNPITPTFLTKHLSGLLWSDCLYPPKTHMLKLNTQY